MALQDILEPPVEALHHAVGLRPHRWREAMLDPETGTEAVELVVARGRALAQAEQPVGELLAVVGENTCDLHRRGALQVAQEAARVGGRLRWVDADEDPSGR